MMMTAHTFLLIQGILKAYSDVDILRLQVQEFFSRSPEFIIIAAAFPFLQKFWDWGLIFPDHYTHLDVGKSEDRS